jgi:sec-independent protein translocase protein TatA
MGALKPVHILILILVIVILFGWKKLPDAARSLGRSMRIFKSEVEEMKKDGKTTPSAASSDTVKGETVHRAPDSPSAPAGAAAPIADPSADPSADAVPDLPAREKQNQPPN